MLFNKFVEKGFLIGLSSGTGIIVKMPKSNCPVSVVIRGVNSGKVTVNFGNSGDDPMKLQEHAINKVALAMGLNFTMFEPYDLPENEAEETIIQFLEQLDQLWPTIKAVEEKYRGSASPTPLHHL